MFPVVGKFSSATKFSSKYSFAENTEKVSLPKICILPVGPETAYHFGFSEPFSECVTTKS